MTIRVQVFDDARDLLARAEPVLRRRTLQNNLELAICEALAREPEPALLLALSEGDDCLGVAVMRPGQPLVVSELPRTAIDALASYLCEQAIDVRELQAPEGSADALRAALERCSGAVFERGRTLIIYAISTRAQLTEPVHRGRTRLAGPADQETVAGWLTAFCIETGFPIGSPDELARVRIKTGRAYVYELDAELVSLACIGGQARGITRVGPVFTPPERRGQGHARAVVGAVTREILERGDEACLFAEADNPSSSQVYVSLGYREIIKTVTFQRRSR